MKKGIKRTHDKGSQQNDPNDFLNRIFSMMVE
jgi:hypothetical protein